MRGDSMQNMERETCEQQYKDNIVAQLKFFVQKNLFYPITDYQTIHNWIKQFPANSLTPYFILDTLIILTTGQVEASLKNIVEQIMSSIYKENPSLSDEALFAAYRTHLEHSVFLCACSPGQMAGGAPETMRALRNVIGKGFCEVAVTDLCKTIKEKGIRNVYIVDDLIGTGETIKKQLKHKYVNERCICGSESTRCSLECASKCNKEVKFTIISVILHQKGKLRINNEFQNFNLLTAYNIDIAYNLLSEKCELYRDPQYKEKIIADIQEILRKNEMTGNPYALYLPVGINGAFPNNSLELFWWTKSSKWKPLFPRQH